MELIRRDADYALRALLVMASGNGPVCAREIARIQKTPFDFLQKILRKLKKADIVKARRGTAGGFTLARNADEISLLDILEAVQGRIAMNRCLAGGNGCPMMKDCSVRPRLAVFQQRFRDMLQAASLSELLEDPRKDLNFDRGVK